MDTIHVLHAELEELKKKYWHCFNNWDCDESLGKIECQIEAVKYKLSVAEASLPKMPARKLKPFANTNPSSAPAGITEDVKDRVKKYPRALSGNEPCM